MEKVEKRHIQKIEEDENSVTIKFGKSENYEEMEREGHDDKEDKGMHDDDKKEKGAHEDDEQKNYHMDKDKEKSMHGDDEEDEDKDKKSMHDDKEKDRSENLNRLFRSAFLNKRKVDDEKRTAEFSFMSDEPVERDFGIESIDVTKTDMSFVSSGRAPLLLDHDTKAQIGVIEKAEIVDGKGRAIARLENLS